MSVLSDVHEGDIVSSYIKKQKKYDIAVIGGGIAGISAALSAARLGKKVVLAESSYILGGLATSGLVTIYLPLCDGLGRQVSFGIAEELLKLSISYGSEGDYPSAWLNSDECNVSVRKNSRYLTRFNPHVFAILCEKLLLENGVEIIFGAKISELKKNSDRDTVLSVSLLTNTDAYEIIADSFIDCTGDASVFYLFGAETVLPEHKNADAAWYYEVKEGEFKLKQIGNCSYIYSTSEYHGISGLDSEENTLEVISSHARIIDDFLKNGKVSQNHAIATLPTIPQIRMSRMIKGVCRINKNDDKKYVQSSVGMFPSWLEKGPVFELPIESLYCSSIKNLCTAGRSISVEGDDMWDITRVIPVCAVSGEAAGVLAAVSSDFKIAYLKGIQNILTGRGVKLHLSDITNF